LQAAVGKTERMKEMHRLDQLEEQEGPVNRKKISRVRRNATKPTAADGKKLHGPVCAGVGKKKSENEDDRCDHFAQFRLRSELNLLSNCRIRNRIRGKPNTQKLFEM